MKGNPEGKDGKKPEIFHFARAHLMSEEEVKRTIKTPAVLRAFERAKLNHFPDSVRKAYNEEEDSYTKYSKHSAVMHQKGKEEGLQEGLEKGQQEGFKKGQQEGFKKGQQEGLEKGEEKGRKEEARKIAKKMLKSGLEISLVCNITKLSETEIKDL